MKKTIYLLLMLCFSIVLARAQHTITATVLSADDKHPLAGASIVVKKANLRITTDALGRFTLNVADAPDTLIINYVGYKTRGIGISGHTNSLPEIILEPNAVALSDVVVNTGYYRIPRERATGSFTQIDNNSINRSVSTNILDRLEGITSGLLFDRRNLNKENASGGRPELRIRGLSTIEGNASPLIVVDNLPYEGDLASINPNDVESITILKDAAAASIWGARAGNGVIVINSKNGRFNQPTRVSFNSNLNFAAKPDLHYNQNWLPSETVMGFEKELFERGAYPENDQTRLPAYVELLIKKRDLLIGDEDFAKREALMKQTDLRSESLKYLYQTGVNQQYGLNISGGSSNYNYYLSGGYDRNSTNVVGNSSRRLNLSIQNTVKLSKELEFSGSIWYTKNSAKLNGLTHNDIGLNAGGADQYVQLADNNGNSLPISRPGVRLSYQEAAVGGGLQDWLYRPLDEQRLADNSSQQYDFRINGGIKYSFLRHFDLSTIYQYTVSSADSRSYYAPESYFARDLINKFTQPDGRKVIPAGGILDIGSPVRIAGQTARTQLNYRQSINDRHDIVALAGSEISERIGRQSPGNRLYDYRAETGTGWATYDYTAYYNLRPQGFSSVPMGSFINMKTTTRNLSYFGNAAYTYLNRYTASASMRWDGSNLLGVKSNQRGTGLWSAGASWQISKEKFYVPDSWLPYLRLRATYGSAGNTDKSQSHYPVISIGTNDITGLSAAVLSSPGNPSLRWEQVSTLNLALDWSSRNDRLSGSIEWYNKQANHLLGDNRMDPTTGVNGNFKINYASLNTRGIDFQLNSRNLTGEFSWSSALLLNYAQNRVTDYNATIKTTADGYWDNPPLTVGKSRDLVYAFPWNGLNPNTGQPLIYVEGVASDAYVSYYNSFKPQDLIITGQSVPPLFGSMLNTFSWKGIELGALVSFKTGFVFRRNSMYPGEEYFTENPRYHADYFERWTQPGDEARTDVPGRSADRNEQRKWLYQYSEALITRGDVVRLQDVNLSYTIRKIKLYAYARNLAILWRANKSGIDPDYPNADYPAPKTYAIGIQTNF